MDPKYKYFDMSERPCFWVPKPHQMKNALMGMNSNIAMLNPHKVTSDHVYRVYSSSLNPNLSNLFARLKPEIIRSGKIRKAFRYAFSQGMITDEELKVIEDRQRRSRRGMTKEAFLKVYHQKWREAQDELKSQKYKKS